MTSCASRGRAGPQSRRRKDLHRKVQPERRQRGDSQQPARTEQERQDDESSERIFGENIAVPDQAKVDEPERQQHDEPAHEQRRAALALRKPLELDGKACAEQQRKQRQVPSNRRPASGWFRRRCRSAKKTKEAWGIETARRSKREIWSRRSSRRRRAGHAPQHVDGVDPLCGAYRPGRCGAIGHCNVISSRAAE